MAPTESSPGAFPPVSGAAEPRSPDQKGATRTVIAEGALLDRPFLLSNLAATVIACAGLLSDSAATIIGAMLVATLMGPIMGIGLALVDFDNRLLLRALWTLVAGSLLVVGVGVLFGLAAPLVVPGSEMLSRTSPHLADLIVALASGAISAYATTTPRLSAALIGVSIAVALVPPLATAGLFLSRADFELAGGAFMLAFVNVVAIQVGTSATLWLRGFRGPRRGVAGVERVLGREAVSLVLILALAVTLGIHGVRLVRQRHFEASVEDAVTSSLLAWPEARLTEMLFTSEGGRTLATAVVRSSERLTPRDVAAMEERLPKAPDGSPVRLKLRHIEVEVVSRGD